MAIRRLSDMNENELRDLIAEITAHFFKQHEIESEIERQFASLPSDQQTASIRQYIRSMLDKSLYDSKNDPAIGMFSFEPDFASTSSDILRREYGLHNSEDPSDE